MKKQLVFLLVLITFDGLNSVSAQTRFAPQFGYATTTNGAFQLGFNAELFANERISIQPAFNYYFVNSLISGISYSYWSVDADGHYYFDFDGSMKFYALLGMSYLHGKIESSNASITDSAFGINLGWGANFKTKSSLLPFVEIKYNSPWNAMMLTAGLRFGGK